MRSYFDRIDAKHKPRKPEPLTLAPPNVGDLCAHPSCGGTLQWGSTPTSINALRCEVCGKEPRR